MAESSIDQFPLDPRQARQLAGALTSLLESARQQLGDDQENPLRRKLSAHVGRPVSEMTNVVMDFGRWEHVNVHRGAAAYLTRHTPDAEWFGMSTTSRLYPDIMENLNGGLQAGAKLTSASYTTVATGPNSVTEAVQFGLVLSTAPDGAPVVIGVRGGTEHSPVPNCQLLVLAATAAATTTTRDAVEELIRTHDVFRGAILQFDVNDQRGNELLSFLPRPALTADQVILPAGLLERLERHVVHSREHNERLVAHGQHLKRGVLLYGPPGTGKTHTVRYLLSRLTEATVVVLSGRALRLLPTAAALIRRLQPAVLVIEDVDLIAHDRSYGPVASTNPLLFELLNRIDGIDADADVTFLLTTNRVDMLEQALADRPGRIDLAMEIPRPSAVERARLLRLYTRDVDLRLTDEQPLVDALDGVAASFVRELVRRALLRQLELDTESAEGAPASADDRIVLDEAVLLATLAELADERQALTSRILGGRADNRAAIGESAGR